MDSDTSLTETNVEERTPVPEEVLDTDGLAVFLKVSRRTVQDWRVEGTGPDYIKLGRRVRYRMSDVQAWMDRERVSGGHPHQPRIVARVSRWRDFIAAVRDNADLRDELLAALALPPGQSGFAVEANPWVANPETTR